VAAVCRQPGFPLSSADTPQVELNEQPGSSRQKESTQARKRATIAPRAWCGSSTAGAGGICHKAPCSVGTRPRSDLARHGDQPSVAPHKTTGRSRRARAAALRKRSNCEADPHPKTGKPSGNFLVYSLWLEAW